MAKTRTKSRTDVVHPDEMEALARAIDAVVSEFTNGERKGFALLVFDFGIGGNMQYCSNANRQDMIAALRELLGQWSADGSVQN
jgi:hypothetical protein